MGVELDERRHDGLAGQVDTRRPPRERDLSLLAHAHDSIVLDDEGRVLEHGARFAGNETRAFEQRDGRTGLSRDGRGVRDENRGERDDEGE